MLCGWCLGPILMKGVVHGRPMDGCGTVKNSPDACLTEHVQVNFLELDGFNYVWKMRC